MKAIVWSNVGCSYCEQAKKLLKSKDIEVEERNLAHGTWTVQQLQEAVHSSTKRYSHSRLGMRLMQSLILFGNMESNYVLKLPPVVVFNR